MRLFRTKKRTVSLFIAIFLMAVVPRLPSQYRDIFIPPTPSPTRTPANHSTNEHVARVIDGDTIELDGGQRVRYIGIDTPETKHPKKAVQCFGAEAYAENRRLVEGKTIRMVKDVSDVDKYGRLLRYVYVSTDASPSGIFINDYLVQKGYAFAVTFPPDVRWAELFRLHQATARIQRLGLWSACQK